MTPRCIHLQAATIGTEALVARRDGAMMRGELRWCSECGAVRAIVEGEHATWMRPGSPEARQAMEGLRAREFAQVIAGKGKPRVRRIDAGE